MEPSKDELVEIAAVTKLAVDEKEVSEMESIEQKYLKTINNGSEDSHIIKRAGGTGLSNLDQTTKGCSPPDP